jgi:hypothetical protein
MGNRLLGISSRGDANIHCGKAVSSVSKMAEGMWKGYNLYPAYMHASLLYWNLDSWRRER